MLWHLFIACRRFIPSYNRIGPFECFINTKVRALFSLKFTAMQTEGLMIDQTSEAGKQLQAVVKSELKGYLGKDYDDDVLPLYIVVMLAHGNQEALVAENLDAFLGKEKAPLFATW